MISWQKLNYNLTTLAKLKNGGGSEIEFCLQGKRYMIIHYRNEVTLAYYPKTFDEDGYYVEKSYSSMDELGEARDFGFHLKDEWKNVYDLICSPPFDEYSLEDILESYRSALEKNEGKK